MGSCVECSAAIAVQRYRFFGRSTVSFLVILPIALPGIVTGIALNAAFLAADANCPIEMLHLLRAFELENAKLEPGLDLAPLRKRIAR